MIRLFVSLTIPENIREKIIKFRCEAYAGEKQLKWEPKEKLHCTLKFIGDVKKEIVPEIADELNFLEKYSKFNCTLDKFGFFFHHNEPKILWAGFKADSIIYSIVENINSKLEKFLISKDKRKFKSHITILRLKENPGESFLESFRKFEFPECNFTSNEIVLYKSNLLPGGSEYTEIKKYKLK